MKFRLAFAAIAFGVGLCVPFSAGAENFEANFDQAFGTDLRAPPSFQSSSANPLEQRVYLLANSDRGRIGVAAIDLATGKQISILGDQRFPLASTSKIAIAAAFLEGVDQGKWSLDDKYPLLETMPSKKFSGAPAPLRAGRLLSARELIDLMITRSDNEAADGLLHVVGGPRAVNDWVHRAGISEFNLDRYISTLVRDDGEFDPADHIDTRDSATPLAMATLVKGLYDGRWLSRSSRDVLLGAMGRCKTGPKRIPGQLPGGVQVAHKTGSLFDTSSDVGIVTGPDGHSIALAIYVTGGKNDKNYRFDRIATIAKTIYDGYFDSSGQVLLNANYAANSAP